MDYFRLCFNVASIKEEYRKLAFANHPDKGGNTAIMQDINKAYHEALKLQDGREQRVNSINPRTNQTEEVKRTYKYDFAQETAMTSKLYVFFAKDLQGVTIDIKGTWLWVSGNVDACQYELQGMGFKHKALDNTFYWHEGTYKKRGKRVYTSREIDEMHGRHTISQNKWRISA